VVRVLGYRSDSRHYKKKKVVGLERGPLSLVSTTEELLDRKVAAAVYKTDNSAVGMSRWPRGTLYPQKFAITSPTSGGRSVGRVRSRTQTMEFFFRKKSGDEFKKMLAITSFSIVPLPCLLPEHVNTETQYTVKHLPCCSPNIKVCIQIQERQFLGQYNFTLHYGTIKQHNHPLNPLEPSGYYMYHQP
jgi:hypothetical protein